MKQIKLTKEHIEYILVNKYLNTNVGKFIFNATKLKKLKELYKKSKYYK